jgi:TIR domain
MVKCPFCGHGSEDGALFCEQCKSDISKVAPVRGSSLRIFISYRRTDDPYATHHLRDRLAAHFGAESVFMDVDSIPVGVDFVDHLQGEVQKCSCFVVVIGERWLEARFEEGANKGKRRLDDENDYVRVEIEAALARGIPVVPVLVGRAFMPGAQELPETLQKLARKNAAEVRAGRDMETQTMRLIRAIEKMDAKTTPSVPIEKMDAKTSPSVPIDAYTGTEPFLFVSYCHRDRDIVYPEIVRLQKKGFRIWYDEGITPGKVWPEEIGDALSRAAFFVVFVSPRAMSSKNVRNEINYALQLKTPFLAIYLEETKLDKGMWLQMGARQAIFRYEIDDSLYVRRLNDIFPPSCVVAKAK